MPPEPSFFGVQGWRSPTRDELRSLQRAGVGSVRVGFNLADGRGRATAVSPLGASSTISWRTRPGPTSTCCRCSSTRRTSARASAPGHPGPPAARREWAGWIEEAVGRYGPNGSLWSETARGSLPARDRMAGLERAEPAPSTGHARAPAATSRCCDPRAGRSGTIDPGATVVLAGIPNTFRGIRLRRYLRSLYRQPGFERLFDVIAMHPYARDVDGVERGIDVVRRIMRRFGDVGRRTWITEIGWATGGPYPSRFRVSVEDQAERAERGLRRVHRGARALADRARLLVLAARPRPERSTSRTGSARTPGSSTAAASQSRPGTPSRPSRAGSPATGSTVPSACRRPRRRAAARSPPAARAPGPPGACSRRSGGRAWAAAP